jgi:hypothetical protein
MGATCDVWLWDGTAEYEGVVIRTRGEEFSARVRTASAAASGLGRRRAPASTLDLHRLFTRARFLAHLEGFADPLLEVRVTGVQCCRDGEFDYLLTARLVPLRPEDLEELSRLPPGRAAELFQRRAS